MLTLAYTAVPRSQADKEEAPQKTSSSMEKESQDVQALLDERDAMGCTPLHYATKEGHLLALEELITLGATPSVKNNDKQSPFHFAARSPAVLSDT